MIVILGKGGADDKLNGNVDLTDPCLDFSNAIPAWWYTLPTVSFSVDNTDVCEGECVASRQILPERRHFDSVMSCRFKPPPFHRVLFQVNPV